MELSVEFAVDAEDAEATASALADEGGADVEELEEAGILPAALVVVIGIIAVSGLANVVMRLSRAFACGVVIDTRGETVRTRKDGNLPRGTVVVLTRAGEEATLYEPSQVEIADVIKAGMGG